MATSSMAPSLYAAPLGLDSIVPDMGNPITDLPDGSVEIIIEGEDDSEDPTQPAPEGAFGENLAESMSESDLQTLASDLMELVDMDIASRKDWVDMYIKGMDVLGMKYEERTEPWAGACGVYSTILTEAAVRFQADTITETFPAAGPVKTEIMGAITKLKEEAAERVQADMNYQLTEAMPEYRTEHEKMLYSLGLAGAAFKKVYFDNHKERQVAPFIPAEDMIIPYGASDVANAERATHIMRKTENEVRRLQVSGFYRDVDLGEPRSFQTDVEKKKAEDQGYAVNDDNRYTLCEIHIDYLLPGGDKKAGYEDEDPKALAHPYVVTIERGTNEVLAVRRNWKESDKRKAKRQHFVQYTYIPWTGAYGLGLIHLIGGYARAGTSIIRQLVDAGTLSNLPGGLKTRGMRTKGDDTPIAPGEFRDVDIPSGSLKDNIMPLPYKEPSQVLAGLLERITDEGRRLGSIADMDVSDMSGNAPVGTTLALLERQLKTMGAVQARVHNAMKQEFKLLKAIIRECAPKDYDYDPETGDRKAKQADYDMVEVIPVSDPNSSTMAQRIMQYQAAIQLAQMAPQIYNLPNLHRQMLEVLGIRNADKLVATEDDQTPKDPVSENIAFLTGKPTKAFIAQDHDAHIAVHSSMLNDPMVMSQLGQNPMAQQIQASIMSHIAEHVAFQYRTQIEQKLGASLPAPDSEMDPDVEAQLSRLVAQASVQLMQQHQQMAAQKQAQQVAQDPMFQLEQQKVAVQQQKVQSDAQLKAQELALKEKTEANRAMIEAQKVGVMGRAQDQELLNQDRMNAAALEQQIQEGRMSQMNAAQEAQRAAQEHAAELDRQRQQAELDMRQQATQHAVDLAKNQQAHEQKLAHAQALHVQQLKQAKAMKAAQPKPAPAPKGGKK